MKIQVLGSGCPRCKALTERVESAVAEVGLDCEIEKVTEINEIVKFGVMMTPGLVIDGEVKSTGKLLSVEDIKAMLS
ncbi:MAG: thioredoxin family protein [Candidatus Eisenbacteria bacterium]